MRTPTLVLILFYWTSCLVTAALSQCTPFNTTFPASDVSTTNTNASFLVISPNNSYTVDEDGLVLHLYKPEGTVTTVDGVNSAVGQGATVNSTFSLLYGKVTFQITAPQIAGVVTAAILIGSESHDEIDIEILGAEPYNWQTNVFAPQPTDTDGLAGTFSSVEGFPSNSTTNTTAATIAETHNYTIDWNAERIIWDVDGVPVRTIYSSDTSINGTLHFPSHETRVQLGIWDASSPAGTCEWAQGPIVWDDAPSVINATLHSITVECYQ